MNPGSGSGSGNDEKDTTSSDGPTKRHRLDVGSLSCYDSDERKLSLRLSSLSDIPSALLSLINQYLTMKEHFRLSVSSQQFHRVAGLATSMPYLITSPSLPGHHH